MRVLLALALLLPANASPPAGSTESVHTAGPWVDCLRKIGREHYQRRDSADDYDAAIDARCASEGASIRQSHPNVYRLSREDALETYRYCLAPGAGSSQRCRVLRQAS